jgi:hypothetical protein
MILERKEIQNVKISKLINRKLKILLKKRKSKNYSFMNINRTMFKKTKFKKSMILFKTLLLNL